MQAHTYCYDQKII